MGDVKIFPMGDGALTVEFGTTISEHLNRLAIALAERFTQHPFEGFIEAVPAYASTTIFYDLIRTRAAYPDFPTVFAAVSELVARRLERIDIERSSGEVREVSIPVEFGGELGPDLAMVAAFAGIAESEVIDIFTSTTYRVHMLGFLPGFSYMAAVDRRIAMPRRGSPRTSVPKGSVGIAGEQTGIYPLSSPGGWQIIGRTSTQMFNPELDEPAVLRPGDLVRFIAI